MPKPAWILFNPTMKNTKAELSAAFDQIESDMGALSYTDTKVGLIKAIDRAKSAYWDTLQRQRERNAKRMTPQRLRAEQRRRPTVRGSITAAEVNDWLRTLPPLTHQR